MKEERKIADDGLYDENGFWTSAGFERFASEIMYDLRQILHCPEGENILAHAKALAGQLKLGPPKRRLIYEKGMKVQPCECFK
jgi:hypothetical protein